MGKLRLDDDVRTTLTGQARIVADSITVANISTDQELQVNITGLKDSAVGQVIATIKGRREVTNAWCGTDGSYIHVKYNFGRLHGKQLDAAVDKLKAAVAGDIAWKVVNQA